MIQICTHPSQALQKLSARPGTNLLDNWYFGNPVNQRAQSSYTTGYTIDRWCIHCTGGTTTVTLDTGGITLTTVGTGSELSYLQQIIDVPLAGQTLTVSILTTELTAPFNLDICDTTWGQKFRYIYTFDSPGLFSASFEIPDDYYENIIFNFGLHNNSNTDITAKIVAVKLEIGPSQTLAHKVGDKWELNEIPNYTLEYLKCCRYQYCPVRADGVQGYIGPFWTNGCVPGSGVTEIFGTVTTPVPMRKLPTAVYKPEDLANITFWNGNVFAVTSITGWGLSNGDIQCAAVVQTEMPAGPAGFIFFPTPRDGMLLFDANL